MTESAAAPAAPSAAPANQPFVGFVLLNRPGWDADDFIESFGRDWGVELEVLPEDPSNPESSQIFCATLPGVKAALFVTEMPINPASAGAYVEAARENYLWPEGREIVKTTASRLVVTVTGEANRTTLAALFVRAAATILDNESAIGFLDCDVVFDPVSYRDLALSARDRALPTLNLFWVGLSRCGTGFGAWTSGLSRFGKPEMEVPLTSEHPGAIREFLMNVCAYVLEDDVTMKSGETIGYSEDQRLPLIRGKSSFFDDLEVLQIRFDAPGAAPVAQA